MVGGVWKVTLVSVCVHFLSLRHTYTKWVPKTANQLLKNLWIVEILIELIKNDHDNIYFSAILLYFHQECKREAEENERNRYNDVYNPEETDWTGELPFRKADAMELDLNIGKNIFEI